MNQEKEVVLCSHRSPSSVPITKKLPVIREHLGFESILRPFPTHSHLAQYLP